MFLVTVVGLFSFLRYGVVPSPGPWLLVDTLLTPQFVIPHSLLLHPATRKRLRPWVRPEFYGAFFCVGTCVGLLPIFTVYIAIGSVLKDRRLLFYLGDSYRHYMEQVAGYPLVSFGPLAKLPLAAGRAPTENSKATGTQIPDRLSSEHSGPAQSRSAA